MAIKYTGLATLKAFKDELDLRYAAKDDVKEYKLVKLSSASDGAFASYQLQVDGAAVAGSATIDVPKDYLIRKAELKTVVDGDDFIGDDFAIGDKYIALTINAKDATLGTDDTVLRINVKDLFNEYTSGEGIEITNGVVSLKVASGSPLSIDGTTGELKIASASTTTAGILSAEDYTKFFNASEATITIGAAQGTGNVVTAINNVGGAIVPTLGITALTENDLVEITNAEVTSLWGTPTPPAPTKYTVTFNSNEGSPVDPQEVEEGGKVTKPADPTKDGYDFGGWFSDAEFNTEWNFETGTVAGAMTLHAKWDAIP